MDTKRDMDIKAGHRHFMSISRAIHGLIHAMSSSIEHRLQQKKAGIIRQVLAIYRTTKNYDS
jgi:hypothetical protein